MSHRLEGNEETKYADYKEPKTSQKFSTKDEDIPAASQTKGDRQTQDAGSMWNLARESNNPSSTRGSYADKDRSVDNVVKEGSG